MSKTPVSKTQERAIKLLGLTMKEGYAEAAQILQAAGCNASAQPAGGWRTAAKMTDEQFINAIVVGGGRQVSSQNLAEYGDAE